jgi:hypothetical protein
MVKEVDKRNVVFTGSILCLVALLLGSNTQVVAQGAVPYSSVVTPSPFLTPPSLQWTITNVTNQVVEWGWGTGSYWKANRSDPVTFEIAAIQDNEVHGQFTIGNLTLLTNDSRIAIELVFSIWFNSSIWFPGLVSPLDWVAVDQEAAASVSGWMAGDLEIRTSTATKTYIYHQGVYGNQNTTLIYDIRTGVLVEAYTEFFFFNDYHLGLLLIRAARQFTLPTLFLVNITILAVVAVLLVFIHKRK